METRNAELSVVRAGFVLFTLSLLTGLAVPAFLNPRMAVAAHLSGAGHTAAPWKETVVQGLQVSIVLVILAGAVSVVYALRSRPTIS